MAKVNSYQKYQFYLIRIFKLKQNISFTFFSEYNLVKYRKLVLGLRDLCLNSVLKQTSTEK